VSVALCPPWRRERREGGREGGREEMQQLTGEVGAAAGVAGGDLEAGARVGSSHALEATCLWF
jgi:hypothetical protein